MMKNLQVPYILVILLCLLSSSIARSESSNDADALQDLKVGKVVWDVTLDNPTKLMRYLKVIQKTYDGLVAQKVTPDMIFTFHGGVVKLITTESDLEQLTEKSEIATLLADLQKKAGIKMEVCGIAMETLGVKKESILPGIKPVGNTFISLIGYHAQGYAMIPVH
jgi:intracellular sulfur oxidation DsrE/DsrF family protein